MNLTHLKSAADLAKTSPVEMDIWRESVIDPDDVLRLVEVARKAENLLRRATTQIERWSEKYGEFQPEWLPPAGDVRLLEDIEDFLSTQKGGPNADGSTLRTDALTVGRDTVTNAQDRINFDAFTDLALLRESDLLRSIAADLEIMLASATQHASEDCVTGYTVKTGALHRIIGTLVGNGFRVTVPLAAPPTGQSQGGGET
jgi:hypothetical protein